MMSANGERKGNFVNARKVAALLKRLTPTERQRYDELLAGRTSIDGKHPMRVGLFVCLETIEQVRLEAELGGFCCAACREKARAKDQPRAESNDSPAKTVKTWEGRKITADELRLRMREIRQR